MFPRVRAAWVAGWALGAASWVGASQCERFVQRTYGGTPDAYRFVVGVSADGETIVFDEFVSDVFGPVRYFVLRDDGAPLQIASVPNPDRCDGASLSGDGRWFAYASNEDPLGTNFYRRCQVFVVGTDGNGLRQWTRSFGEFEDWETPDLNHDGSVLVAIGIGRSSREAFAFRNGTPDPVAIGRSDSYRERYDPHVDGAGELAVFNGWEWGPSGLGAEGIAARTDGTEWRVLTANGRPIVYTGLGASVDDEGRFAAFNSFGDHTGGNPIPPDRVWPSSQIFTVDLTTGLVRQITGERPVDFSHLTDRAFDARGEWVAFGETYVGAAWPNGYDCRIVVARVDGSESRVLLESTDVCDLGTVFLRGDARRAYFAARRDLTGHNPNGLWQVFAMRPTLSDENQPPEADAGPDRTLECTGDRRALAHLDGSASCDPDGDGIVGWEWSEDGEIVARGPLAEVPLGLGSHEIRLQVSDEDGAAGSDVVVVAIADTEPPQGGVTFPPPRSCHGPPELPVVVRDSFRDRCDPEIRREYDPPDGPAYSTHGDHDVTVTGRDGSGNSIQDRVAFVVDTRPPTVQWAPTASTWVLPSLRPFSSMWSSSDDDGAAGGIVRETLSIDGCVVYDGATYGNRDGRLSDESLVLDVSELCRLASNCGFSRIDRPEVRLDAWDCGGNRGSDSVRLRGGLRVAADRCPE